MQRDIRQQLLAWQQSASRKPLVMMGARQVGKTTSLLQFAEQAYRNSVYVNFEDKPSLRTLFAQELSPKVVLNALEIEFGIKLVPEHSLIILDEIQACPEAVISLKYFNEQANEYHVVAAGSLLGVKILNSQGFPVGKVDFIDMWPMSFSEFLVAVGEREIAAYLAKLDAIQAIPANIHDKCIHYFRLYLYVGGMPEAVKHYVDHQDLQQVRAIQQSILRAYSLDFSKHAPAQQIMKINQVWQSLPSQLSKENKKFVYSVLRQGARAKEFEAAIQWLVEAGLVYRTHYVSTPKTPLKAYARFDYFRLYLVDVGLLGAMVELPAKVLLQGNQLFQEFHGVYTENVVAQILAQQQQQLYYWVSEGKAELDFMLETDGEIYPLEVKSGMSSKKKSLQSYLQKYRPGLAVCASPMNLRHDELILNCPLYLLHRVFDILAIARAKE